MKDSRTAHFRSHQVSRRAVLRGGLTALGGLVAAGLVSCGSETRPTASATAAAQATAAPAPTPTAAKTSDVALAKQEGKVRIYAPGGTTTTAPLKATFEKAYPGIVVEIVGDPIAAFLTEARKSGGIADVIFAGEADLMTVVDQSVLASYLPRDTDWIAPDFKDKAGRWTEDVPILAGMLYNTSLVTKDQAPKTFKDLADPKWKGKLGYIDPRQGAQAGVATDNLAALVREYGDDFMRALAAQRIRFYPGGAEMRNGVAAGEVMVSPASNLASVETLKGTGRPVDWIRSSDNAYITSVSWIGISSNAPHPNAAMLFVDFFFSRDGMQSLADANVLVTRPGVTIKNAEQSPQGKKLLHAAPQTDAQRAAFLEKYKEMFAS